MMDFWFTQAQQLSVSQGIHRNIRWYLQVLEKMRSNSLKRIPSELRFTSNNYITYHCLHAHINDLMHSFEIPEISLPLERFIYRRLIVVILHPTRHSSHFIMFASQQTWQLLKRKKEENIHRNKPRVFIHSSTSFCWVNSSHHARSCACVHSSGTAVTESTMRR